MATALVASVPFPLLLDSFLASSWPWLALSLATIATLLRALSRVSLSRHRPEALLPPPPTILCAEREQITPLVSEVSHPLWSTQKRRNKSTLNLFQNPDGLACPDGGFFPCMRDHHAAPLPLCDAALAPMFLDGQPSSTSGEPSEGERKLRPHIIDCRLGLSLRLGFLLDTQRGELENLMQEFVKEDVNAQHLWTSGVFSRRKPLQNSLFDVPSASLEVPLCFEVQFGWHRLLEMRLGAPWHDHPSRFARGSRQVLDSAIHNERIVKVWSTHQKNLLKALMVEESSITALDVNIKGGWACTGYKNGEISRWDISNQARLGRVCSNVRPISALCLNAEKGVAIAGNWGFLGLWDYKSPSFIPIPNGNEKPVNTSPCSALRCEGDLIHIDRTNGLFSSCDLRKPQGSFLSIGANSESLLEVSKMEEDESFILWEKLACDEDDVCDEYLIGHGDALQKGSSFATRCATLVRSLSTPGR